jgi:4'-phosphopantetheinyl transferase
MEPMLSPDEAQRAVSYRQPGDRQRFVERRGLLRSILSLYVGAPPGAIRLLTGRNGKPALDAGEHDGSLRFSLAHSGDVVVYAVTRQRDVGVDVEEIKPLPEMAGMIARFFTAGEAERMRDLAEPERQRAFFTGWTRKEAYVKALGDGLSRAPDQVDVGPVADLGTWRIETIIPVTGYVGAVAAEGDPLTVRCLDWPAYRTVAG